MALPINIGSLDIQVTAEPLTQSAFAPFGDVVGNPRPDVHPSSFEAHASSLPPNAVSANQGSAIQYRNVSRVRNCYDQAPSGKADPAMSMFVCSARELDAVPGTSQKTFTVRIMERHPFTTQTFTPVSSSASSYLVIVAPSLAPGSADEHLPVPQGADLPGRGLVDVKGLRAFVATNEQAVTYGAGTWHAPMVVMGQSGATLDFVVSQFMSGVGIEDCQLVGFESDAAEEPKIEVRVPQISRPVKL